MYDHQYELPLSAEQQQQQELLIPGRFAPAPRSAQNLTDRMEASGAKIEATLVNFNLSPSILYFFAAWAIILAASIGLYQTLFSLSFVRLVESAFLLFFGVVMLVIDVPGAPKWAARYRRMVFRQIKFLTRTTGKAIWNLYLGVMILVVLWPTPGSRGGSGVVFLLGISFSALVLSVAVMGLCIGLRKSMMLDRIRKEIANNYRANYAEVYRKYAITDVGHGLQFQEFARMSSDYSQGRVGWTHDDLALIYNALDEHQKGAIGEKEFSTWISGPFTYL